jgi:hypothetical protein
MSELYILSRGERHETLEYWKACPDVGLLNVLLICPLVGPFPDRSFVNKLQLAKYRQIQTKFMCS